MSIKISFTHETLSTGPGFLIWPGQFTIALCDSNSSLCSHQPSWALATSVSPYNTNRTFLPHSQVFLLTCPSSCLRPMFITQMASFHSLNVQPFTPIILVTLLAVPHGMRESRWFRQCQWVVTYSVAVSRQHTFYPVPWVSFYMSVVRDGGMTRNCSMGSELRCSQSRCLN